MIRLNDEDMAVFRLLNLNDYTSYMSLGNALPSINEDLKESIFEECLIEYSSPIVRYLKDNTDLSTGYVGYDDMMRFIEAGSVETIVNSILNLSGAFTIEKFNNDLIDGRISAHNGHDRILHLLSSLYKIPVEKIETMYWLDILKLIAQGELILGGQIPEVPFKLQQSVSEDKIDFQKENKEYDSL